MTTTELERLAVMLVGDGADLEATIEKTVTDVQAAADEMRDAVKEVDNAHKEMNDTTKAAVQTQSKMAAVYDKVTGDVVAYRDAQGRLRDELGRYLGIAKAAEIEMQQLRNEYAAAASGAQRFMVGVKMLWVQMKKGLSLIHI